MVSDTREEFVRWALWWGRSHSELSSKNDDIRSFGTQMTSPLGFQQLVQLTVLTSTTCVRLWGLFALLVFIW